MAIRLSGLSSGMDTESIVAELVKAKSIKKDKLVGEQKKLSWKQDAWKELNTKIYSFYSKTLSNLRFKSDYNKKTTTASHSAVSVITSGEAPNCVQTLKIEKMAAAGYLTGKELASEPGTYTSSAKITSLPVDDTNTIQAGASFTISANGESKEINITEDTTISDVVSAMREVGVNANFDEKNQRFYISAKSTGAANDFTITANNDAGTKALKGLGISDEATRIAGSDAEIKLNNATYKSDRNTFEINGLTISINSYTDQEITLTTQEDTNGIYDMVKNFFKEYNELINEMDKLYNAKSASKYDMLTDEEREALPEKEAEEWDEKIKSALLRRDSTLGTVFDSMKTIMLSGVEMADGSTLYLSDFGINTLGYFNAKEFEKNAYHIEGNPDDTDVANKTDKLKAAIASDPDTVADFFARLSRNLYGKLDDLMARTDYSSAFTVYNDKSLKEEYTKYTEKISSQEEKISDFEDRYYKKFAKMEAAMSKLNSQQSSISSLFGM